jgi:hypothetical protein
MSRDYSTRSRSRSRDRGSTRNHSKTDFVDSQTYELGSTASTENAKLKAATNADDAKLAEDLGYSTTGRDQHREASWFSMSSAPIKKAPSQPFAQTRSDEMPSARRNESDDWGYTPKPYVPQAIPLNIPILANPVVHPPPPPPPISAIPMGAHIVIENIPADLNINSLLQDHFKQYGDVQSVHCIPKFNKALVDFSSRETADKAAVDPVLGIPTIRSSVYNGPARGFGRSPLPSPTQAKAPSAATTPAGPAKNLVLESETARKARERREMQLEADKKRQELLMAYTEHVKQIVAKLADKSLKEELRGKYQEMLSSVKAKIADIQKVETERKRKEQEAMQKALAVRYKAYEKQARLDSNRKQQEMTLDLRSRCVKISELPEELSQSVVLVEYLRAMGMKDLDDVIWLSQRTAAVLRFSNHTAAEQLVKHELAFKADWVANDEANNLSIYNEVEKVEILPLEEDDEAELLAATEQAANP